MNFPDVLRTICGTINRTDFCKHSLTSAGKGIIDGSGHFSFLNTVMEGLDGWKVFIDMKGGEKTHLLVILRLIHL